MTDCPRPVRIQLSRRKGFNLRALSIATNGLPVVNCARPGNYGNWYIVGPDGSAEECVAKFRAWLTEAVAKKWWHYDELRGKNLACWCKLPKPGEPDICHAAVILEFANAPICEAVK
jgi:hypothetical protein